MPLAKLASTNQKHYPDLGSDASSVWNFCARFPDVNSRETVSGVAKCPLFSHATLPGRRLQLDTFSSNGVGFIEIAKCAIFSRNCAISCDTRAHFLLRRRVKEKQTKWRRK